MTSVQLRNGQWRNKIWFRRLPITNYPHINNKRHYKQQWWIQLHCKQWFKIKIHNCFISYNTNSSNNCSNFINKISDLQVRTIFEKSVGDKAESLLVTFPSFDSKIRNLFCWRARLEIFSVKFVLSAAERSTVKMFYSRGTFECSLRDRKHCRSLLYLQQTILPTAFLTATIFH